MVIAAEWQTAGRGRRGRSWTAVAGGSLTFSLGWQFEQGAGFLAGLSLAVGVAVVRALEAEGFAGVALKWPNDLVHRHHKLGGILIDINGDALGPSTTVIGVGLNVRLPANVRKDIPVPVTDLTTVAGKKAPPVNRNHVFARLLDQLAAVLQQYATEGFAPFAAEWQHRHAYQGKMVKLLLPDGATVTGKVAGVDASGALVLADGPRRARFLVRRDFAAPRVSPAPYGTVRVDHRPCSASTPVSLVLAIDIGNSRMKWALHGPHGWRNAGRDSQRGHRRAGVARLAQPAAADAGRRRQRRRRGGPCAARGAARALASRAGVDNGVGESLVA